MKRWSRGCRERSSHAVLAVLRQLWALSLWPPSVAALLLSLAGACLIGQPAHATGGGGGGGLTVSITTDIASPQTLPAPQTVTFTAAASGGTAPYEYEFRWSGTETLGQTVVVQSYSPTTTWSWTPVPAAGTHVLTVWVRTVGDTVQYAQLAESTYVIDPTPASSVTLSASVPTPQPVGTVVDWVAQGYGGTGEYEYQFYLSGPSTTGWEIMQSYSPATGWRWATQGVPSGTYQVAVYVRNAGSTAAYESTSIASFGLGAVPMTGSVTLTPDAASPQPVGTVVELTAVASGGSGQYEYEYYLLRPGSVIWELQRAYSPSGAWQWVTQGLAAGNYTVRVLARNAGSTAQAEAARDVSYTLSGVPPVASATLTPDVVSPASVGTVIEWTAQGAGGTGLYEYEFYLQSPGSATWVLQRPYGPTNTWRWVTQGLDAGIYTVDVLVRNVGSTAAYETQRMVAFTLQGGGMVTGATLTPDVPSPREVGSSVTFTAQGAGGNGRYEYQFRVKQYWGTIWTTAQPYSRINTWTWTPTAADLYAVEVQVRNVGSTAAAEASQLIGYTIEALPTATGVTLTASLASPQEVGTAIGLTAQGSGGLGLYEYQFRVRPYWDTVWIAERPYSPVNTWTWTPTVDNLYMVQVWVRNAGSTVTSDATQGLAYTITALPVATGATLTPDVASPQEVGTAIGFTAQGSGGLGVYEYEFRTRLYWGSTWTTQRAFSPVNTWTWTPTTPELYVVEVGVRNAGSGTVAQVTQAVAYTIDPLTSDAGVTASVTADVASPQQQGTAVTFTAVGAGGTGSYEYRYLLRGPSTANTWVEQQAYSTANTWAWDTTGVQGAHTVQVQVRNAGSAAAVEATSNVAYTITVPTVTGVTAAPDLVSPQQAETAVTFTAAASGGTGSYEYEFWLYGPQTVYRWQVMQAYSALATWTWDTTGAGGVDGVHTVHVRARNTGSTAEYEVSTDVAYTVTPVPPPPVPSVAVTPDAASPQEVGTAVTFTAAASGGTGSYEYEFWLYGPVTANRWQLMRAYSAIPTWLWDTTGAEVAGGVHTVHVRARNAGSTADYEADTEMSYTVAPVPPDPIPSVAIAASELSPQAVGTPITFTATGSGGTGSYEYEFWLQGLNGEWNMVQAFAAGPTWAWTTTGATFGDFAVEARVRNAGSTAPYEAAASMPFTLAEVSPPAEPTVTLSSDIASPQEAGNTVTFTATGSGGTGSYEYEFWLQDVFGIWTKPRPYAATATWSWSTAGLPPGDYTVEVSARNVGSTVQFGNTAALGYTVTPAVPPLPTVTLTPDVNTPQVPGTTVAFTATGAGGTGSYEYEFWVRYPSGMWATPQAYSSLNTWSWDSTGLPYGLYEIEVRVRNAGSTAAYEGHASGAYSLEQPPCTLALTAPVGGELWSRTDPVTVSWSGQTRTQYGVTIGLYKNGVLADVLAVGTENDGTFTLPPPNPWPLGVDYRVRVLDAGHPICVAGSPADFTIRSLCSLLVTNPPAGSTVVHGQTYTVTWIGDTASGATALRLEVHQGGALVDSEPYFGNDGSFTLTIPATWTPASDYTLRLIDVLDGTCYGEGGPYVVTATAGCSLAVTIPAPGDTWIAGGIYQVQWSGGTAGGGATVDVDLYRDGVYDRTLASNVTNLGQAGVELPVDVPPGSTYRVRVVDTLDGTCFTESGDFFVDPPPPPVCTLALAAPQGGAVWAPGSVQTITWSGDLPDIADPVRIDLYRGGEFVMPIVGSTPNDGSYDFAVPADLPPGTDYQVRIFDPVPVDVDCFAQSDGAFAVLADAACTDQAVLTLVGNLASPQTEGTPLSFTAVAGGPDAPYEYQFAVSREANGNQWEVVPGGYTADNTMLWTTAVGDGSAAGSLNTVRVQARPQGATTPVTTTTMDVRLTQAPAPPTRVSLSADTAGPFVVGTPVTFRAFAAGGAGPYEYEFRTHARGALDSWVVVQAYGAGAQPNVYTWTPQVGDEGEFILSVWARTVGATGTSVWTEAGYTVVATPTTPDTFVALTPDVPSPQVEGASVTVTAAVTGPPRTYECEFAVSREANGNEWEVDPLGFQASNAWTWTTVAGDATVAGASVNTLRVRVREQGQTAILASEILTYTIVNAPAPATRVTLRADQRGPFVVGVPVTFTAQAEGGTGGYEYKFQTHARGVSDTWVVQKDYGFLDPQENTFTWTPVVGDVGEYILGVWARTGGMTADQAWEELAFTVVDVVDAPNPVAPTLVADLSGAQLNGVVVTFTAAATCGTGLYEYQFTRNGAAARTWSTDPVWSWDTTGAVGGTHNIVVSARTLGTSGTGVDSAILPFDIISPAASVTLTPSLVSPQVYGPTVTWTAAATGGSGTYEYEFVLTGPATSGAPVVQQAYSGTATWAWLTTLADVGANTIEVRARNVGSTVPWEATASATFDIAWPPPSSVNLTPDVVSPQESTTTVTFTAAATGESGSYEYEFELTGPRTTGAAVVQQAYSVATTWAWVTTAADEGVANANTIVVRARNTGDASFVSASVPYTIAFDLTPPQVTTTVTPAANVYGWHTAGPVTVSFTCTDTGSGVATCPAPVVVPAGDCVQQVASGIATDVAGNSVTVDVPVKIDALPPTIDPPAITPAANAAGWHNTDVSVSFTGADTCSAVSLTPPVVVSTDGASQQIVGTATDEAGNTAQATATISLDKTPPVVTSTALPPPNAEGWNNTDVTVDFSCTDATSGVESCPPLEVVTGDCGVAGVSGIATDIAGNSTPVFVPAHVDTVAPVVAVEEITPAEAAPGWYDGDVYVAFSTVEACSGAMLFASTVIETGEGAGLVVSSTATDFASNTGTGSAIVNIDRTPPVITDQVPAPQGQLADLQPGIIVCFDDPLSGVDVASVRLVVDGVDHTLGAVVSGGCISWTPTTLLIPGPHTAEVQVSDVVGHTAVSPWTFDLLSPIDIQITEPPTLTLTSAVSVQIQGTVTGAPVSVTVNDFPATVTGSTFTVPAFDLHEGTNYVTAVATTTNGTVATDTISVVLDTDAPVVVIESPFDDPADPQHPVVFDAAIPILGTVNDAVLGTVGPDDCTVQVTGRAGSAAATVYNRSFSVEALPLVVGPNTITAVAVDAAGNQSEPATITVIRREVGGQHLELLSAAFLPEGPAQPPLIAGTLLPEPVIVRAVDGTGAPLPGRALTARVTRNDGLVSVGGSTPAAEVTALTDATGELSVDWTLGTRVGAGMNRLEVSGAGFPVPAQVTASATAAACLTLAVFSGQNQVGVVGEPLARPLKVSAVDAFGNPCVATSVVFRVEEGGGTAGTASEATIVTNGDGHAEVELTLGYAVGVNSHRVTASFPGSSEPGATFVATSVAPAPGAPTRFIGTVLDTDNNPLPFVPVSIRKANPADGNPVVSTQTDEAGQFILTGVPPGRQFLEVIPPPPPPEGGPEYPRLEFDVDVVTGIDNRLDRPVFLPKLDSSWTLVGGAANVDLYMAGVDGYKVTVIKESTSVGGVPGAVQMGVTQVDVDQVPMPHPGVGDPPFEGTLQPPGVDFNPPAQLTVPNASGYPPGAIVDMFSFDHSIGQFISIGTGTVQPDGATIVSDPGSGLRSSGWHGPGGRALPRNIGPSDNPGDPGECPCSSGQKCVDRRCVPDDRESFCSDAAIVLPLNEEYRYDLSTPIWAGEIFSVVEDMTPLEVKINGKLSVRMRTDYLCCEEVQAITFDRNVAATGGIEFSLGAELPLCTLWAPSCVIPGTPTLYAKAAATLGLTGSARQFTCPFPGDDWTGSLAVGLRGNLEAGIKSKLIGITAKGGMSTRARVEATVRPALDGQTFTMGGETQFLGARLFGAVEFANAMEQKELFSWHVIIVDPGPITPINMPTWGP